MYRFVVRHRLTCGRISSVYPCYHILYSLRPQYAANVTGHVYGACTSLGVSLSPYPLHPAHRQTPPETPSRCLSPASGLSPINTGGRNRTLAGRRRDRRDGCRLSRLTTRPPGDRSPIIMSTATGTHAITAAPHPRATPSYPN